MLEEEKNIEVSPRLQKSISKVWELVRTLLKHIQTLIEQNKDISKDYNELKEELELARNESEAKSKKISELYTQFEQEQEKTAELTSQNKALNERISELNWQIDEINKVLVADKEIIRKGQFFEIEYNKMNSQFSLLQEKNKFQAKKIEELLSQIEQLQQYNDFFNNYEKQIEESQSKIEELQKIIRENEINQNAIKDKNDKIIQLNLEIAEYKQQIALLESNILLKGKLEEENSDLKAQVEVLKVTVAELRSEINNLNVKNIDLQQEITTKTKQLEVLLKKSNDIENLREEYLSQINYRDTELYTLRAEMEQLERHASVLNKKIESMEEDLITLRSDKSTLKNQIEQMKLNNMDKDKEIENLKLNISELQNELGDKQVIIAKLESQVTSSKVQLEEKIREIKRKSDEIEEINKSFEKFKLFNTGLFADKFDEIVIENENYKNEISLLKQEHKTLIQKIEETEKILNLTKNDLNEIKNKFEEEQNKNKNKVVLLTDKILELKKVLIENKVI